MNDFDRTSRPVAAENRIIHISESFGGGVAAAIRDYARATPELEHHLVYSSRADAPLSSSDLDSFVSATELPAGHLARVRRIRKIVKDSRGSVVHAHSSFGGAYARVAIRSSRSSRIVYTPHCYGFERTDIPRAIRGALWAVEGVLALNTATFAACSPREARLSRWPLSRSNQFFVPNVAPTVDDVPRTRGSIEAGRIRIVGGGRIGPQKDADYFLDCADLLLDSGIDCELVWIGGGADEDEQKLRNARIRVTGWLDRREVLAELVNADVYLHTAAWEGFPVAILEAASLGLPVVARSIPAFEGVALPLLLEKPTDVVEVCRALLDPDVRTRAASDTRLALQRNTLASQGEVLRKIYAGTTSNQSWEK